MKGVIKSNILSIEIGSYNIKILIGKEYNKKLIIKKTLTFRTPENSFADGKITDFNKIKSIIGQAITNYKLKAKKVIFTLSSSRVITREIVLPKVKNNELSSMIEFEIDENFPIDLDKHIIQYKLLESFIEEGLDKSRILVSALPKDIGDNYYRLAKELNLKPHALDITSNVNSKFFSFIGDNLKDSDLNNKTIGILDIGHNNINLVILENSVIKFNRILNIGGKDINENISRIFDIDISDGELKKHLIKDINEEHLGVEQLRLSNVAKSTLDGWNNEILRMFKYYTSRKLGNKIDEIYLHGGCVNLKGLTEYLEEALDIPTFKVNTLRDIIIDKTKDTVNITTYVNTIGAFIGR